MKLRTFYALVAAAIAATLSACGDREHTAPAEIPGPVVLSALAVGSTWIDLSWQAPAGVDASGGVRIFRDNSLIGMSMDDAWTDKQLTPDTRYVYRVTTIDANGRESGLSNLVAASTIRFAAIALGVSPSAASIEVGDRFKFTAVVEDSVTGQIVTSLPVTWSSANASVASVGSDGTVTAVAVGTVAISASVEGTTVTAIVTVRPVSPVSVVVSPAQSSIQVTKSGILVATARDAAGNALTGRTFAWTTSDASVATVSPAGVVTGVAAGTATIGATTDGITGTAAVTIVASGGTTDPDVSSLTVNPGSLSLTPGNSGQVIATARDGNGNVLTNKPIAWSTSNSGVATVSQTGVVSAVSTGSAAITATSGGLSAAATITVLTSGGGGPVPVANVAVTPSSSTIQAGGNVQLTATTRDNGGNVLVGRVVTWASSNPSVATVSATGAVAAVTAGAAVITASSEGINGSATITVTTPPPAPVATVVVMPGSVSINVGGTAPLTATTKDAQGTTLTGRTVTWASSDQAVATVSAAGVVTSVSVGAAVITATSEGVNGSATVTVTTPPPVPVATVAIAPSSLSVNVGASGSLTATTKDAQGNTLAGRVVTWASSDQAVATVSGSGVVTGVAVGTATITATSEGIASSITATVTPKPVVSVTITGTGPVCVGASLQLTATPKDADGNPLTGRVVVWTTSTGALATVSPTGLVLGVAIGTVTITATVEGVSATTTIGICAPIVATVTVSAPSGVLSLLGSLLMSATAKDAYGNVILGRPVTWSVSPPLKALISVGGLLTPISLGQVTVTATIDGISGSTTISIVP
jgi:trimeric autotransporter adhesin